MSAEQLRNDLPQAPEVPVLKEREVKNPEEVSAREFSKANMQAERDRLAAEIKQEWRTTKGQIQELRVRASLLERKLEATSQNIDSIRAEIENLESVRTERANSLAGKVRGFLKVESAKDTELDSSVESNNTSIESLEKEREELAAELDESTKQLVDADAVLGSIKAKVAEHYGEAGDRAHSSVEQTMLRTNAFFVHTILENSYKHHNENSNVSQEATFEDDIDILLSLEPSISASSVMPGADEEERVSGLWGGGVNGGVILGGGHISLASRYDSETVSTGIKTRAQPAFSEAERKYKDISTPSTFENRSENWLNEVDAVAQNRGTYLTGGVIEDVSYNEFVIDNPEAIGYFQPGAVDDEGMYWINSLETRKKLMELNHQRAYDSSPTSVYAFMAAGFNRELQAYRDRIELMKSKGVPSYVMTPDRRLLKIVEVNNNGSITVGAELTPEEAARGRAGLPPDARKEIGEKLLQRQIFKTTEAQDEAREIVGNL